MMKKINIIRVIVFCVATYSLAMFFEAGRLISSDLTLKFIPMSFLSILAFIISMFVIGYWVYVEEKEKNNLAKQFGPYESVYKFFKLRKN